MQLLENEKGKANENHQSINENKRGKQTINTYRFGRIDDDWHCSSKNVR